MRILKTHTHTQIAVASGRFPYKYCLWSARVKLGKTWWSRDLVKNYQFGTSLLSVLGVIKNSLNLLWPAKFMNIEMLLVIFENFGKRKLSQVKHVIYSLQKQEKTCW